jgi:hypothetical protein
MAVLHRSPLFLPRTNNFLCYGTVGAEKTVLQLIWNRSQFLCLFLFLSKLYLLWLRLLHLFFVYICITAVLLLWCPFLRLIATPAGLFMRYKSLYCCLIVTVSTLIGLYRTFSDLLPYLRRLLIRIGTTVISCSFTVRDILHSSSIHGLCMDSNTDFTRFVCELASQSDFMFLIDQHNW